MQNSALTANEKVCTLVFRGVTIETWRGRSTRNLVGMAGFEPTTHTTHDPFEESECLESQNRKRTWN